jgi:hypothetical protein
VASVPPAARLVEVIADRGESAADRYRYGSGCIVSGRTVLTAAHVVAGAQRVQVRDPDKKPYSATVDPRFVGDANEPGPDLALVEIEDPAVDLAPMGLARVDRDAPTDEPVRCRAIGYPWFAETPSPAAVRDTVDAIGVVPVLSKLAAGLLSVQVSISPRPLPPEDKSLAESEWSGMSGAPVVAAGRLLGVVVEHAPREGPSAITAVPLTVLEQDPAHPGWGPGVKDPSAWWARLGVTGLPDLQRLPVPPPERPEPAYWETVREFGRSPPLPRVPLGIGGWSVGCMPARPRCCTRRSPLGCPTKSMWSAISCLGGPPTPIAAASWLRLCPSWPFCAGWIRRSRTGISSMRCGGGRPNALLGLGGRCCWWSMAWTRTSGRVGCRVWLVCCRRWWRGGRMCWWLAVRTRSCRWMCRTAIR